LLWVGALCALELQCGASAGSLLTDLEQHFKSEGLVIASVQNQNLIVFPFSGRPFFRKFFDYNLGAVRFSPDGTAALGYLGPNAPWTPTVRLVLIESDGRVTARLDPNVANIGDMALSFDHTTVAFAGGDQVRQLGIFLGNLATGELQLAVPLQSHAGVGEETSVAWLPDGSGILYSQGDKIWTYDLGSRQSSLLNQNGTNPSCSPDGKWTAYRGSSGHAMLFPRHGGATRRASKGKIIGRIHWSPDSVYYFVDEKASAFPWGKCAFGYCFVVYRPGDGSRLELYGTALRDSSFGWLRGPWPLK